MIWSLITVIFSILNGATRYMLKVKYSDLVAGFMENVDFVLPQTGSDTRPIGVRAL
jgi:hypothetical protein